VGRNDDDDDKSNGNDAMTAMAIPAERNDMGNAMATTDMPWAMLHQLLV